MIFTKKKSEIEKIRKAATVVAHVLASLKKKIQAGATGIELNQFAEEMIRKEGCKPNFLGYKGFPATICLSRNENVIHGIPNHKPFVPGDLISVDVGCSFQGFHADAAISVAIPPVQEKTKKILVTTKKCLDKVVFELKPGDKLSKIGKIVEKTAKKAGFYLVDSYSGHGIGKTLHEKPIIYNLEKDYSEGILLQEGMTICVEPILLYESPKTKVLSDKWTVVGLNGQLSCHFEHTLLVTKTGIEVLTNYERFSGN